jgi:DNA-binding protein YbaB
LKARESTNVTITTGYVTVTVSPQLELLAVVFTGPGVLAEHRDALQSDIVDAVNKAMREVVIASAQMLEGLQESPEIQSFRDALQKQMGQPHADAGTL